jgi:hypothetical protein
MQTPAGVTILPELLTGVEDVVRKEQHVTFEAIKKQLPAHGLNLNFAKSEAEENVKRALHASDQIEVVSEKGGEATYRWVDNEKLAGKSGVAGEILVTIEGKEDAPKTHERQEDLGQKEDNEKIVQEKKDSEGPPGRGLETKEEVVIPSSSPRVSSIRGKERLSQLPMQARNMKRFLTVDGGNGDGARHETHRATKKPKQGEGASGLILEGLRGMPMELHLRCENFDGRKGNVTGSIEIVGDSDDGDDPTWD